MSKELSKTYDPKDIEDRLYKKQQETVYHCDATAKYYRSASHGTCTG